MLMTIKRCFSFILPVVLASVLLFTQTVTTFAAVGPYYDGQSWAQRKQIFVEGKITNEKQGVTYNLLVVPGFKKIVRDAKNEGWVDGGNELIDMVQKDFWHDRGAEAKDGLEFSRYAFWDSGFGAIDDDFRDTIRDNADIEPGSFGSFFVKVWHWISFGLWTAGRVTWAAVGGASGVVYAVVKPAIGVALQPVKAVVWDFAIEGAVYPAAAFVWHTSVWVGTSFESVPEKESKYVRLVAGPGKEVVLTEKDASTIIAAGILVYMNEQQTAVIQKHISRIQDDIDRLREQIESREGEINQLQAELRKTTEFQALQELISTTYSASKVSMNELGKELLADLPALKNQIRSTLTTLGIHDVTDEQVGIIANNILAEVEKLLKEPEKN